MLGQLQNAAGLDELMNSSKPVAGNFDRAGSKNRSSSTREDDSSFSHMLLATLNKAQAQKETQKPAATLQKPDSSPANEASQNARRAFAEKVVQSDNKSKPSVNSRTENISKPVRDDRLSGFTGSVSKEPAESTRADSMEARSQSLSASQSSQAGEASKTSSTSEQAQMGSQNVEAGSPTPVNQISQGLKPNSAPETNAQNLAQLSPEQIAALVGTAAQAQQPAQAVGDQLMPSATAATSDAKSILSPLKNLMTGKSASDALINRNPVLAFVTGHLEKLDPETLPALVSDSALIKQAMTANDVAQFMQTPMSISDLASLLELDQTLLNKASQAGLDPSKLVTPKEFLQALGLDAGRITSELTILKQKLPVDGVASYVQRAKAMATNADKAVAQSPVSTTVKKLTKDASSEIVSGQKSAGETKDRLSSDLTGTTSGATSLPVVEQASVAQLKNNAAMNMAGAAQSAQSNISGLPTKAANIGNQASLQTVNSPVSPKQAGNRNMIDPAELLAAQAISSGMNVVSVNPQETKIKEDQTINSSITLETQKSTDVLPQIDSSSVRDLGKYDLAKDPYSELGRQMDMSTTTKIEFGGDGISQRSIEEHLLSKGFDQSLQMKPELRLDPRSVEQQFAEESPEMVVSDNTQDIRLGLNQEIQQMVTPAAESPAANLDFSQGESFQDGSASLRDQTTDFAANISKSMTDVGKSESTFTDKVTEAPKGASKDSIAAKILGQAQMMFKNGGGSMRLDMEAPGIGKVDVAINLINNQLDVRIITASEQARDMISKEVVGLRDGLTQQGISLRGLEVGKAGESSPRNFAGQGQQFGQGADQQRASYNDMREYAQSFRNSFAGRTDRTASQVAPALSRWSNAAIPSSGSGRLEVRV